MSATVGNDLLMGTTGNDFIDLLTGNDSYAGLAGNDTTVGNDGNDSIIGDDGSDSILGGNGADFVDGGLDNDTIIGGNGNDIIIGGAGSDSIDAGAGTGDMIRFNQTGGEAITVNISLIGQVRGGYNTATVATATQGTDSIINFENINGSVNNDFFNVTDAATFYAGLFLFASSGNDTIINSVDLYGPYSNVFASYDALSTNTGFTRGVSVDLQTSTDSLGRPIGSATDYAGTDSLVGVRGVAATSLNDTIYGTGFDDRFRPSSGNDIMDGRDGFDMVDYGGNSSSQAVSVNLVAGRASDGRGGTDTLISIENARGGSGNDTLLGDKFSEAFRGNAGNDTIDGGLGSDRIEYSDPAATSGVSVNLITGTASDGLGGTDSFTSIENVFGGELNDYLVGIGQGGQSTSRLRGDAGNDTLIGIDGEYVVADYGSQTMGLSVNLASGSVNDGLGGVDSLVNIRGAQMFGNFADTLIGSNGDDWLAPSAGNDSIVGGNGFDVLSYDGNPTRGVSVNLATGTANDGDGGTDIFTGIEAVRTGYSNDTVIGDSGFNAIVLGAGADYADAAGGRDVVSYRFGFSLGAVVYSYNESGNGRVFSGVTIDLAAGRATDYGNSVDTILNFEDAEGSVMHDSILGSSGDNEIDGWEGNDTINAGGGNDTIWSDAGDDLFMGGAGNDLYLMAYATGNVTINDASGNDTVSLDGAIGQNIEAADLSSAAGIEAIDLAGGGNILHLTATRAIGVSGTGLFRVFGSGGDRLIFDDTGWVRTGSSGGFDTLSNSAGNATVIASGGLVSSDIGSVVNGGDGNDTLTGGNGADTIDGGNGADIITDFGGNDSILGNDGNDSISGGNGADIILGGNSADTLDGGADNDSLDGGNGSDVAAYSRNASSQAVSVNLLDGRANDGLGGTDTLISIENIWGSSGNDTIIGSNDADFLWGNSGNDTLVGGNGADTLDGGSGNDTITGGDGSDRIFGGTGSDSIDAGAGTSDVISFNHTSAQAVSATISAIGGSAGSNYAVVNSASQGNDTIINFENIQGTFENDGFTINSAATDNALLSVFGSIGADTIAVNIASNAVMADYNTITGSTNFTRGVIVDLNAGTADDGRGGIDSLIGVRGVSGSSFGDTILGSVFNDRFREQGGSDSINGRDGFDMLDYSGNSASQAVSVNLAAERASDGRGGTDTVISMEYARAGSGNDTLIGNAADNELRGGSGADILDGGASGFDIADYANNTSAQAISVNLIAGRASDGFGFNDTLVSIEYIRGGSGDDTMIGSGANERFRGNAGNDTIDGGNGTEDILDLSQTTQSVSANLATGIANDGLDGTDRFTGIEVVYSGTASDTLLGSDRNEIFDGGMGGDLIDGGLGYDRVRYWNVSGSNSAITRGVSVDLAAQRATDGWGGQDTLIGIERVTATNFNDTLFGDNVGNRFNGRAGNDSIDGGLSIDWLEYLDGDATSGVTVNLTTGTASDGRGGTDIFTSIENVSGQDFADHLTGIAQLGRSTSRLRGGGGNDTLVGMANEFVTADYTDQTMGLSVNLASGSVNDGLGGVDQLINIRGAIMLGDFADTIIGTAGNDWLSPSGSNDTISGGDGLDIISYDGNPTSGVSVNLAAGRASDGDGGTDSLSGIEGVWVSYSNDTVIGDGQGNLIGLGAGADSADAAAGQDTISYSLGFSPNTSVYVFNEAQNQLSFTGVTIDLAAGRATDFGGATDTILNFEAAIGSTMHDSILGSNGNDVLDGAEGSDTINGGGGGDTIYAGAGDVIHGGAGDDVVLVGNVTLAEINALFAQWQP